MKKLTSPVKEFPGTIEFPDSLTLPQLAEYSDTALSARGKSEFTHVYLMLPVQRKLTGEWSIDGLQKDRNFEVEKFEPLVPLLMLLKWIHEEFVKLMFEAKEIPNASSPTPIDG